MPGNAWNLKGKSVLITGAARGIGAATARLLAGHQTRLSLIDIEGAALQQLARDLGETMLYQQADITQSDAMEEAVAATVERFGRIDVAVVNAGIVTVGSVGRGDPERLRACRERQSVGIVEDRACGPAAYHQSPGLSFCSCPLFLARSRDRCMPRTIAARRDCRPSPIPCAWRFRVWVSMSALPTTSIRRRKQGEQRWNTL